MKSRLATTALVAAATVFAHVNNAYAQQATGFPGNEAVRIVAGKRVVEAPPTPRSSSKPKPEDFRPPTHHGNNGPEVTMIEGPDGLMACSDHVLIETACIPSDIGTVRRPRIWLVKLSGKWQRCNSRVAPIECKPLIGIGMKPGDWLLAPSKSGIE